MVGGVGVAGHHHGELFQGAVVRDGEVVLCLITMPARGVGSTARYVPGVLASAARTPAGQVSSAHAPVLEVLPAWKTKAQRAAALALAFIGAPAAGRLELNCAVATGVGLGSSTCDVVAAIRAVCSAYDVTLDSGDVARLAIEAEGAADPIMFDGEMVLFAQRHGRVLESFASWVPCYTVLSIDTDEGSEGVDTLSLPCPAYTDSELAAFESLVGRARDAFQQRDSQAIAAIATESAALNQRFLALRNFRELRELAEKSGALGVQISHSGTLAGILFDPCVVQPNSLFAAQVADRVRALRLRPLGLFTTGTVGG